MPIYKHDDDTIEAVETAAAAYQEIADKHKELTATKKDAAHEVTLAMKRAGITYYIAAGGLKVELDVSEKIRTKRIGG